MKNHYYTYYYGNKRNEIETILPLINLDNITTIIEPFAGSSAMSYYIFTKYPKRFKYILNDNDKINYQLFNVSKDFEKTQKFNENINKLIDEWNTYEDDVSRKVFYTGIDINTLEGYIFTYKYRNRRPTFYPLLSCIKQIKPFKLQDYPVYNFYNNEDITYSNIDGIEIIKNNYNVGNNSLFLIDPPYLKSSKKYKIYNNLNMNIYDWILEYENLLLNNENKFIFILEMIKEVEAIFSNFKTLNVYEKIYGMNGKQGQRKTKHILYEN